MSFHLFVEFLIYRISSTLWESYTNLICGLGIPRLSSVLTVEYYYASHLDYSIAIIKPFPICAYIHRIMSAGGVFPAFMRVLRLGITEQTSRQAQTQ